MKEDEEQMRNLWRFLRFCLNTHNPQRFPGFVVVVVTFVWSNLRRFPWFCFRNVFPKRINNQFWRVTVFGRTVTISFYWTWNKNTHFTNENKRKTNSLRSTSLTTIIRSTLRWTRSWARLASIRFEWRSVHSRCFWLQFLSARFARWNLDIISTSAPFLAVCGGFCCSVQLGPSMMKSSSSSRAPCKVVSVTRCSVGHLWSYTFRTLTVPETTTTKLSVPWVYFFTSLVEEWTLAGSPWLHAPLEPQRRKLRRLRAALRHEQLSIAMALASALHKSADRTTRAQHNERRHRVLRTFRRRWGACEGASLSGWAAGGTGQGAAAHHGADCRRRAHAHASVQSWAENGGPVGGSACSLRCAACRPGGLKPLLPLCSYFSLHATDGGTVGGSADDPLLSQADRWHSWRSLRFSPRTAFFLYCGADHWHSSSRSWCSERSSRFLPRAEFNSVYYGAERWHSRSRR